MTAPTRRQRFGEFLDRNGNFIVSAVFVTIAGFVLMATMGDRGLIVGLFAAFMWSLSDRERERRLREDDRADLDEVQDDTAKAVGKAAEAVELARGVLHIVSREEDLPSTGRHAHPEDAPRYRPSPSPRGEGLPHVG